MKIQGEESGTTLGDIVCTGRCGVALCDRRGLVSHDASALLVPSGSCIRVFSLATGEPIRTLSDFHEAFVVGLCPSPLNRVHVLSCSADGVLSRWDSTDYALISKTPIVDGNCKVQVFLANRQSPWCVYVSHEKVNNRPKNTLWLRNLTSEEPLRLLSSTCSSNPNLFGIASNSDLVAWIDGDHQLHAVRCSAPAAISVIRRGRGRATCIAVHPTDELVAVGDNDGAIFIHSGPFFQPSVQGKNNQKQTGGAPAMKLHWHSMPVADIHVSGNFLYSVGAEGVLVRWDLESDERQFLPRLGMPIRQLTVAHNEKYVVCAHSDNTMTVVQAPNTVHRVIQGLVQRGFTGCGGGPADLSMFLEPRSGQLVLSGRPGQLQFYNLEHDRQAYVLDVTGENLATDFKLQYEVKKGINSEVVLADFTPDGHYLATVEYKVALSAICKLKFWRWNDERGELESNTTALMPHLHQQPRALRMGRREGCYFCVTAGGRSFKLWTIVRGDADDQLFWQCVDERSYRQMTCRALAISEDQSILAASFGHMVTLWQLSLSTARGQKPDGPDSEGDLRLIGELCLRGNTQEIASLEFGRGDCSTILLSVTARSVTAWDLLSLDRLWSAQVAVRQMLPDPNSSNMAALVTKASRVPSSLFIFRPDKTIEAPIAQISLEQDDQIRCAAWVPLDRKESSSDTRKGLNGCPQEVGWQTKSTLLAMGRKDKLFQFVRREDVKQHSGDGDHLDTQQMVDASINMDSLLTPFGVHLSSATAKGIREGRTPSGRGLRGENIGIGGASHRAVDRLLLIPTHVMPSASVLAESFIKALWLDDDDTPECRSRDNGFSSSRCLSPPSPEGQLTEADQDDDDDEMPGGYNPYHTVSGYPMGVSPFGPLALAGLASSAGKSGPPQQHYTSPSAFLSAFRRNNTINNANSNGHNASSSAGSAGSRPRPLFNVKPVYSAAGKLFSTAIISGSSSAPDLRAALLPGTAEGPLRVPSIRPLETLHNALSLYQLDVFLSKVTSSTYRTILMSSQAAGSSTGGTGPGGKSSASGAGGGNSGSGALPPVSPSTSWPAWPLGSGPPSFVSSSGPSTPTSSMLDIWMRLKQITDSTQPTPSSTGGASSVMTGPDSLPSSRNSYSTPPSPHEGRHRGTPTPVGDSAPSAATSGPSGGGPTTTGSGIEAEESPARNGQQPTG